MSSIETMLVAGVVIPLCSFVLLAFVGARLGKPLAGWVATLAIATSCVLATMVLLQWNGMSAGERSDAQSAGLVWATFGSGSHAMPLKIGVNLDSLTVIMFFMVTFIATWIHVFSVGYMAGHSDEVDGQSKFHRFFCYLSLFCFSMLGLLIADSLLFLFVFWELVGLCSYLLIGFYFDRKYASNAAMKAFITNRVGDLGFLIGLAMVGLYLGDLSLAGAAERLRAEHTAGGPLFAQSFAGISLATWMGMLLFCGAIGKSAQFPLHVWLPDAMAGPTPVSALIHAATMVAAGVYLVARIFVLLTPEAQTFIAVIGCITLTMAALIAIVQTDIKKVLAYSTLSQLGYMILGLGVGAWIGALFHLLTHAFFKALMFLGSGQVIEGCHHEQDIRKMGGLRKKMPVTCWTFFVGVLAIAGTGIPGTHIGLGGFFSKDEILAVAYQRAMNPVDLHGHDQEHAAAIRERGPWAEADSHRQIANDAGEHLPAAVSQPDHGASKATAGHDTAPPIHPLLYWCPLIIAYITPFYMMRCWWLTFMGKPRDEHVYEHAHESPLMYVPLLVLAVGTFWSSYYLFRPMVADAHPKDFLVTSFDGFPIDAHHPHGAMITHQAHLDLAMQVGFSFLVGFALAFLVYRKGLDLANKLAWRFRTAHQILVNKFYFDELYGFFLVGGTHLVKAVCYLFDRVVVDGIVNLSAQITERLATFTGCVLDAMGVDGMVNGVGNGTYRLGGVVRSPQDGRVRNYILFAACGATAAVLLVVYPWR